MKPFTSKHCEQYLTKSSPFRQEEELAEKKISRKKYDRKWERAEELDKKGSKKDEKKWNSGAKQRRRANKIRRKLYKTNVED
jgi:L-serine deaminase